MFNKKTKLKLTDFECNLLINGMNEFRNMLLSDGIPTEDVDDLLLKIISQYEQQGGSATIYLFSTNLAKLIKFVYFFTKFSMASAVILICSSFEIAGMPSPS